MKPTLLTLSLFLLSAFLSASSTNAADQVLDTAGNPIFSGHKYYILPALFGPAGGGLKLGTTGNSECPVTVLQDYIDVFRGKPVKFKVPGSSMLGIYTGTPLEIEFTQSPICAQSSKWIVFVDNEIGKACVGIGGPENYSEQIFSGTFSIEKYQLGYKLVFCVAGSSTCFNIGKYDKGDEEGRRLNLTEQEAFDIIFVDAAIYDSKISTVV